MLSATDLGDAQVRLLDVDNRVVVPTNVQNRFVLTEADVLYITL